MKTEFEAKFYPINKKIIRKKLLKIGAKLVIPEVLTKIVVFNKTFNPKIKCDFIRVRDEGKCITMSAKYSALKHQKLSDQKESMVVVNNFQNTVEILEELSLQKSGYQEKLRETWQIGEVEIAIDTWPLLETYIEIEGPSEKSVKNIANLLGLEWSEHIITSVVEIFMKKYSATAKEILKLFENLTFKTDAVDIPMPKKD